MLNDFDKFTNYCIGTFQNLARFVSKRRSANIITFIQWRNEGGARGDICPRAQHFGGAKLKSECYVLIAKCQMSADASNYNLQKVEYRCEISSRSPRFAKRAIINLSDVSRRSFCLQQ